MPEPALAETILSILRDTDPARRERELTALRDNAPLEALDAIISLLGNPEQEIRRKAVQSLLLFRGRLESRAEVVAEHLVQNADPQIRLGCAILLMDNLTAPVTLAYRRALVDPFEKVAQLACSEVGYRGGDGSTEALTRMLGHSAWRVQLEACKALISQGTADWQVVAALEAMAQEPEARIYDAQCDEFDAMEEEAARLPEGIWREESGLGLRGLSIGGWGTFDLHSARSGRRCGGAGQTDRRGNLEIGL
jgi:hypothetical protein